MHQTSNDRNHLMVDLKLSIGHCKVLERLLDSELFLAEAGTSEFEENTLKRLLSVFMELTKQTTEEKEASMSAWLDKVYPQGVLGVHRV